jgi:hypothetical protein
MDVAFDDNIGETVIVEIAIIIPPGSFKAINCILLTN